MVDTPTPIPPKNDLGPIHDNGEVSIRISKTDGLWYVSLTLEGHLIGLQSSTTWDQCADQIQRFVNNFVLTEEEYANKTGRQAPEEGGGA